MRVRSAHHRFRDTLDSRFKGRIQHSATETTVVFLVKYTAASPRQFETMSLPGQTVQVKTPVSKDGYRVIPNTAIICCSLAH